MIKDYYTITKPGIIYGNVVTAIAGFFLGSSGPINGNTLLLLIVGLSLVIASGCVFNNVLDKDIDALMERTKNRALARNRISSQRAILYGITLGFIGVSILMRYTNILAVCAALIGLFVYVFAYTMWLKRSSVHNTIVGTISGAASIFIGYVAARGEMDIGAILLFFILVFWQMPHAFAIALYRIDDYRSAGIPVLPIKKGIFRTKVQIVVYTVLFIIAAVSLAFFGYVGKLYAVIMALLGGIWLIFSISGFYKTAHEDHAWARKDFIFSIIILLLFCMIIIAQHFTM